MSGYFETLKGGRRDLLIVADHASNFIPEDLQNLGLDGADLGRHIAYDIGTAALARTLNQKMAVPAVLAGFSRLLIDPNRGPEQDGLIPEASDGTSIPGNRSLDAEQRAERLEQFYKPYHAAVEREIACLDKASLKLLSLHSFTPEMTGVKRPWHAGVLYNRDGRMGEAVACVLEETYGIPVGRNQPYPGRHFNHSMDYHAEAAGIPYVTLEIRQDLLADEEGVNLWCDRLVTLISHLHEVAFE